ncbi:hypothetical protein ECG_06205 [Echinococcus granulosus]|uniref:Expressed conserved protein n=1 Tax=Echinococcus granulosus TaxID=6210 RepID=A0A068WMK2_ECHGR|nr:hypothetical protein ECG_06205 [Echinococcus granulosus]CDS19711.1 expressed conserved protein [Echinococcus granulosus]
MAARYQESYGVSSVVPSLSVQPKVGCCRKVSMCCCSCCLAVSAILTIVFFVAGGILVYMNRDNDLITEEIRDLFDNDFRPTEGRVMWKGIGISLLVFGGIMSLLVFITGGFLCCLTPSKPVVPPSVCVVTPPPASINAPALPQSPQTVLDSSTYSKATAPLLEPPPDYAPPSYESVTASKMS